MTRNKPHLVRCLVVNDAGEVVGSLVKRADEIKLGGPPRSVLTDKQKELALALWNRVGRQAGASGNHREWLDGFARDRNPDREMRIWEHIATVTDDLWQRGVGE